MARNTLQTKETVICDYADIYLDTDFCVSNQNRHDKQAINDVSRSSIEIENNVWSSPSDKLIEIIDLQLPFTSKVIQGKVHENILPIGDEILENEMKVFYKSVKKVLKENDDLWNAIIQNEKRLIKERLQIFYQEVFRKKSAIMKTEISSFYQKCLSELEDHIQSEVKIKIQSEYIKITSELNNKMQKQLKKERQTLESSLHKHFCTEIDKVKAYYELLFEHEKSRYKRLKNKLVQEKNDALRSFYNQMEAERQTSTMFVLSLERKKCRMRKLILEKFQNAEMVDQLEELKQRHNLLKDIKDKTVPNSLLKQRFQECTVKIIQIFLRFISFALKLLPEQTQFFFHFQKIVLLQIHEMRRQLHFPVHTFLTDEGEINNFQFYQTESESIVCDKEPFTIVGDLSPTPPLLLAYGSRDSIQSGVDLPHLRVQRQFVYAKCHGFEEIQKVLKKNICKCDGLNGSQEETSLKVLLESKQIPDPNTSNDITVTTKQVSIFDKLEHYEIKRLSECPDECGNVVEYDIDIPLQQSYLDYTEDNFEKVKSRKYLEQAEITEKIKIEDIAFDERLYSATDKKINSIGTQCPSEDNENFTNILKTLQKCDLYHDCSINNREIKIKYDLAKRQESLSRLLQDNPKLINIMF